MAQKPKSLKELKELSQAAQEAEGPPRNIHVALHDAKGSQTKGLIIGACAVAMLLLAGLIFYVYSQGTTVKIGPDDAAPSGHVTLEDGLGWVSDEGQVYVLGSSYQIGIHAEGFVSEIIDITPDNTKSFLEVTLAPMPASVSIATEPAQDGTKWSLDGQPVSTSADLQFEIEPGDHQLVVNHPYFEPVERTLTLERAQEVDITIALSNIERPVSIQSEPTGAFMTVDNGPSILLPYTGSLSGGKHIVQIQAAGYVPISDQIEVTNSQTLIERNYRLRALQSGIVVYAEPGAARIALDGRSIPNGSVATINANQSYNVEVSQQGYIPDRRSISVPPGQTQEVSIGLQPAMGQVSFSSQPRGASVFIGGENLGQTPLSVELQTLSTRVEFRRAGYRTLYTTAKPVMGKPTTVNVKLLTELDARLRELPPVMTDKSGVQLVRFKPDQSAFYIGAPRSEVGQRANEILRQVQLTKHFYASKFEITVGQFRKFQPGYSGGQANNMPVTGVSWAQAVQFCNWLSQQEGLTVFYQLNGDQITGYNIYADGYRLPSEAEWEWLARKAKRRDMTPYTWGTNKTITTASGNLADESAKGKVRSFIPSYNDKYAALAPVGSFPAEVSGLHDMSGNVREWVNDRYALNVPAQGDIAVNSFGPSYGEGNVVKGSGFKSASVTDLRAASRHQGRGASDDIGFRVVRFVYGAEDR